MSVNIVFDEKWTSVAISVSGGADSALLAFLVCELAKKQANVTVHVITHIRCWKTKPWQQDNADGVYNWLVQRFNQIKFVRHTNFIPPELEWGDVGRTITDEYGKLVSGDTLELRAFAEFVCFKNNINAYYNGVTRNPRGVDFKGMPTRDIEPTADNKHLEIMNHMGRTACHPFRFIDKSEIVKMYIDRGIEDLFEITRSCEGTFDNINYLNYLPEQYVPVCGTCFWCKEREWAIESTKSAK